MRDDDGRGAPGVEAKEAVQVKGETRRGADSRSRFIRMSTSSGMTGTAETEETGSSDLWLSVRDPTNKR